MGVSGTKPRPLGLVAGDDGQTIYLSNKSRGSTLLGLIPGFPRFYLKFLENLNSISSVCIGVQLELSQGVTLLLLGRLLTR